MNGELIKAEIINDSDESQKVVCMFNPKEYTFSKQNRWSENTRKGTNVSRLEFGGGAPASLKMQIFFDTYEEHDNNKAGEDVRKHTKALWDMMKVSDRKKNNTTGKGEPPKVRFKWGGLWSFKAVIESISQRFTLFLPDGTPVRAVLDVSFKQLTDEGQYPHQNPTSGGRPGDRLRYVRSGETLAHIASEEYGDPTVWRHLADLNDVEDPLRLRPGQVLVIAPLPTD